MKSVTSVSATPLTSPTTLEMRLLRIVYRERFKIYIDDVTTVVPKQWQTNRWLKTGLSLHFDTLEYCRAYTASFFSASTANHRPLQATVRVVDFWDLHRLKTRGKEGHGKDGRKKATFSVRKTERMILCENQSWDISIAFQFLRQSRLKRLSNLT